jgi:hypothetical protein
MADKDFAKFYGLDGYDMNSLILLARNEVYMRNDVTTMGEHYPQLSPQAGDIIFDTVMDNFKNIAADITLAIMDELYRGIIDPGENREELETHFGWDYPDWEDDLGLDVYVEHNHPNMTRPAFNEDYF